MLSCKDIITDAAKDRGGSSWRTRHLPGIQAAGVQQEVLQLRAPVGEGGAQFVSVKGGAAQADVAAVAQGRRPVEQRRIAGQVQGLRT